MKKWQQSGRRMRDYCRKWANGVRVKREDWHGQFVQRCVEDGQVSTCRWSKRDVRCLHIWPGSGRVTHRAATQGTAALWGDRCIRISPACHQDAEPLWKTKKKKSQTSPWTTTVDSSFSAEDWGCSECSWDRCWLGQDSSSYLPRRFSAQNMPAVCNILNQSFMVFLFLSFLEIFSLFICKTSYFRFTLY